MRKGYFWIVAALLAGTALLLHARGATDLIPPSMPLSQMSHLIAGWSGSDITIDQEELKVLGPGDFLSRIYGRESSSEPIGLFIAYFPTQRTGASIHSPQHCLPGSGWSFESSQYVTLRDSTGIPHQIGEYVIAKGDERQYAIYWYQAHGRSVANEFMANIYFVADAVRMDRTDGALVRVITPIGSGEGVAGAKARAEGFSSQILPMLPRFIPN